MAVPTFDQLLRPILEFAVDHDLTRPLGVQACIDHFNLSDDEISEPLPSGRTTKIKNRAGWAMSHLTKGGLISKVAKHTYRATDKGKEYLKAHQGPITPADLREIEGWKEAWETASKKNAYGKCEDGAGTGSASGSGATPEDLISEAVSTLDDSLRDELMEQLREVDPYRFEHVVLDVLFAMGYGGSRTEAAEVTKRSGDEGIDGVINEDRLGLDVIYVQAKRWKSTVGRVEIQNFVGALAGRQANKGVFITTSDFASTAREYAEKVNQKIVLIDGARLADLMIEHDIGVSTQRTIAIKKIDTDYFEEN